MNLSMKSIALLGVAAVVIILVIAALALTLGQSNNDDDVQEIEDMVFNGNGDNITANFDLVAGVSIYRMVHDGSGEFRVTLYNLTGGINAMLANEIGRFSGSQLDGVVEGALMGTEPGPHYLEIRADGNWTVTVEQPRVLSPSSLPLTISGHGPNVSMPIALPSGSVKVDMVHSNATSDYGGFLVMMFNNDGEYVAFLANEAGNYTGSRTVTVDGALFNPSPGTHWINIRADGDWTITLTRV